MTIPHNQEDKDDLQRHVDTYLLAELLIEAEELLSDPRAGKPANDLANRIRKELEKNRKS